MSATGVHPSGGTAPRVAWDYGAVAEAYLKRPGYAPGAIAAIVAHAGLQPGMHVADVGAGTGNLTVPLLAHGLRVTAIEPNDAMRRLGERRAPPASEVVWLRAHAEATTLPDASCAAVGFGSSFNVVDARLAVAESARILRADGCLFCLWNHRRLDDPLQAAIEDAIRRLVPGFAHGARRDDPTAALRDGNRFDVPLAIEASVVHRIARADFAEAWRSHLTLRRQAGAAIDGVIAAIERVLDAHGAPLLDVPYVTRAWLARRRATR